MIPALHRSEQRRHRFLPVLPLLLLGAVAAGVLFQGRGPAASAPAEERNGAASIAELAARVEQRRGLKFVTPLQFTATSAEVMQSRHRAARSEEEVRLKKRAWCALGFRWEPDWPVAEAFAGLEAELAGSFYDAARSEFLYDTRDAPSVRPEERARLLQALALVLVEQHRGPVMTLSGANDDAAQARASLAAAESAHVAMLCLLSEPPLPPDTPQTVTFYAAPRFMREMMLFPRDAGSVLALKLAAQAPGFAAFDAAWAHPPASTAALLHENRGAALTIPPPALPGRSPVLTGVLGEYGVQTLLRSQLTRLEVITGSEGWAGDAYSLYADDGLVWQTRWHSEKAAAAFAAGLSRTLGQAWGIPDKSIKAVAGGFSANGPRCFRIHRTRDSVLVLTAPDRSFVTAAEAILTDQAARVAASD